MIKILTFSEELLLTIDIRRALRARTLYMMHRAAILGVSGRLLVDSLTFHHERLLKFIG